MIATTTTTPQRRAARVVEVAGVRIGGGAFAVIAGPCAVEGEERILAAAKVASRLGAHVLRTGAFWPGGEPECLRGPGEEALRMLRHAADQHGMAVVTAVSDPREVPSVASWCDMLEIGPHHMHNLPLLREAARCQRPVLLHRAPAATVQEWLAAASFLAEEGNPRVVLCESGIRGFDPAAGRILDLASVAAIGQADGPPVAVYPPHPPESPHLVLALARAAAAAGADGVVLQLDPEPERALCHGQQSLGPLEFADLMHDLRRLAAFLARSR